MPELPEVEQTRRSLVPLIGRRVVRVALRRRDICDSFDVRGREQRTSARDLLVGAGLERLERRGKQLAMIADDGRSLCVQLGMSGRLLTPGAGGGRLPKHTHAAWTFEDNTRLLFIDPRRFGGLSTYPTFEALREFRWSALGPDALSITPGDLSAGCLNSDRAIKTLLLDQAVIAGVGNIYADESLFRARIHPLRRASLLEDDRLTVLARAIRTVLSRAVRAGGSTLRDYSDSAGKPGQAQLMHAVYGRAGQPCHRCEQTLVSLRVSQRTTVFCPSCQPDDSRAGKHRR